MRFAWPFALFALALVPLVLGIHVLRERSRRRAIHAAGDADLMARLLGTDGEGLRLAQAVLLSISLGLVAVALARPQFGLKTEIRKARGMDVVVALDLSRSMLARDVVPSRLERARIELKAMLAQMGGDRVGLVGFTSLALPLSPLTVDRAAVEVQLASARPGDMPRGGTAVGDAIRAGKDMIESSKKTGAARAIVVVTDGEDHGGEPEKAAAEAKEAGIEVHVVGVGSRTGEPIPLVGDDGKVSGYLKDDSGQTVVSRLNETMLRAVADAGGGLAALPSGTGGLDLEPIRRRLAEQKKAELDDRVVRIYEERYVWFLAPAFLLLLLATSIRPSRARRVIRVLVLALALASPSSAQAGPLEKTDPDVAAGNRALSDGKGEEALEAYQRAEARLGRDPELVYNQALAQVARGEKDAAISAFRESLEAAKDPNVRGQAAYALGNTLRSLSRWDEAIEAYRRALMEDPSVSGARRNLEIAQRLKAIQAAQPKDDKNQEPGDDKKNDDRDGGVGDAGPPDAGAGDGSSGDGGGGNEDGGGSPDAGAGGDGSSESSSEEDAGSGGKDDASSAGGGEDAGPPPADAGSASESPPEEAQGEVSEQEAKNILDALRDQEKALKRKRLIEKYGKKGVAKDW